MDIRAGAAKVWSALNTEDKLIAGSLLLTMVGVGIAAAMREPRVYGVTTLTVIAVLLVGIIKTRSPRLAWLLPFGLVAGILELWSDWLHVAQIHSLVYTDYFGFQLLESPSYMPIGWWLTCIQFGYLALRLSDHWPHWVALTVVVLLGMALPPWYEEFAAPAQAWYYTTARLMLSHTPVWIILTYGGCMFSIGTLALLLYRPGDWWRAAVGGVFTAAGFMLSAVFWYVALGG